MSFSLHLITKAFLISGILVSLMGVQTFALPAVFDPSLVITNQDLYSLPFSYSSAEKIQKYLEGKGSFLAKLEVEVGFEPDSGVISQTAFQNKPDELNPYKIMSPSFGSKVKVSELIWNMTRTNFANSCSLTTLSNGDYKAGDICYNNQSKPINPAFIIAMLQKESGTIYGKNASLDPNSDAAKFLIDRILGYYCFENPDKSKSCYDENPEWKYYKGFFRQLYYAVRLLRIREETCKAGGTYAFKSVNGVFQVGSTVTIDNQPVILKNGITCSMYIYTPHFSAQNLVWQIMRDIGADRNLIEVIGLNPNYKPGKVTTF
jgi:hypothetical protein